MHPTVWGDGKVKDMLDPKVYCKQTSGVIKYYWIGEIGVLERGIRNVHRIEIYMVTYQAVTLEISLNSWIYLFPNRLTRYQNLFSLCSSCALGKRKMIQLVLVNQLIFCQPIRVSVGDNDHSLSPHISPSTPLLRNGRIRPFPFSNLLFFLFSFLFSFFFVPIIPSSRILDFSRHTQVFMNFSYLLALSLF